MQNKYGKLFLNTKTKETECFPYDLEKDYNLLIRNISEKGYQELSFPSTVLIELAEKLMSDETIIINKINFTVEDEELENEIQSLINKVKHNKIFWENLKNQLCFIVNNQVNELSKISFKNKEDNGFLFAIQSNGIIVVSETKYDFVSIKICNILNNKIKH